MLLIELLHRAGLSELAVLLAVRLVVFIALFALLPLPCVPRSARLALGLALFVFALPLADGGSSKDVGAVIVALESKDSVPLISFTLVLLHAAVGAALAVALSAGAYAAEALAVWIGSLLGSGTRDFKAALAHSCNSSPSRIVLLIYLAVLSPSLPLLFPAIAESLVTLAPLDVEPSLREFGVTAVTAGIVANTARVALLGALIGAIPLLLVSLTADLFCGAADRLFPGVMSFGLTRAVRLLAIVGGVSIVSAGTERALSTVLDGGLMTGRGVGAVMQVRQLDARPQT